MSELERRYRTLMRAYPRHYRATREDEMVTTLLDRASPGQRWPSAGEVASIVQQGARSRLNSSTEWRAGLRLGGVAAFSLSAAFAVWLLVVAALPARGGAHRLAPMRGVGVTPEPILLWASVVALILAGGFMPGRRARVAVWVLTLGLGVAFATGALAETAPLLRRDVMPLAVLLGLSLAASGTAVRTRVAALALGVLGGLLLVVRFLYDYGDVDFGPQGHAAAWNVIDRWALASWSMHLDRGPWAALMVAAAFAGLWRARIAVAAAMLSVPLGLLALHGDSQAVTAGSVWALIAACGLIGVAVARRAPTHTAAG